MNGPPTITLDIGPPLAPMTEDQIEEYERGLDRIVAGLRDNLRADDPPRHAVTLLTDILSGHHPDKTTGLLAVALLRLASDDYAGQLAAAVLEAEAGVAEAPEGSADRGRREMYAMGLRSATRHRRAAESPVTDDAATSKLITKWFDDDGDDELWETLGWTREQLIDWVRAGGDLGDDVDDFWDYIAETIREEDERTSGPTDESRAAPGRGPGRLGGWYHLEMFSKPGGFDEVWLGRFTGFTVDGLPKTDHLLHFVTQEGQRRTIRYGALRAAVPVGGHHRRSHQRRGERTGETEAGEGAAGGTARSDQRRSRSRR